MGKSAKAYHHVPQLCTLRISFLIHRAAVLLILHELIESKEYRRQSRRHPYRSSETCHVRVVKAANRGVPRCPHHGPSRASPRHQEMPWIRRLEVLFRTPAREQVIQKHKNLSVLSLSAEVIFIHLCYIGIDCCATMVPFRRYYHIGNLVIKNVV